MRLVGEKSKFLKTQCEDFDFINPQFNLDETISGMRAIMKENNGVGLALPQCGFLNKMFLMEHEDRRFVCINPEIFTKSDETNTYIEGCLSFSNLRLNIRRPELITCRWYDENGKEHQERFRHLWARIFQHEEDHLHGITFQSHVSKLRLTLAEKKRMKINGR